MSFMKKGLRQDQRIQKQNIMNAFTMKLNKVPELMSIAYQLADRSKDVTFNNIDSHLDYLKYESELDNLDKTLIIGEYNRIINSGIVNKMEAHEQGA